MTTFRGNVLGLLVGQLSRLGLQAGYFVILARMLGASGYGAFAAALALAALATPFSSLGANTLMLKNVSRDSNAAGHEWKRALVYTILGGFLLAALLTLFADLIAPVELSRVAIFQIAISELVGVKLVELTGAVWQGKGKSRPLIVWPTILNFVRLTAAAGTFIFLGDASLDIWASIYMVATFPLGIAIALHTTVKLGYERRSLRMSRAEIKEGLLYSVAMSSQNVYNDIDKAMLGRIDSVQAAGLYSAGFRIIDMAYAPIRAISAAAYPLYFKEGEAGLLSALKLTRRIYPAVLLVGATASIASFLLAPLTPGILGSDYENAIEVIQLLSPLIVFRALTFLAADTLTGSGRQAFRTIVQIVVAAVNVVMNLLLIPTLGIHGAVISTLVCEVLLASVLWIHIANARKVLKEEESGIPAVGRV